MEAQRHSLGDEVVDAALAPLQHKLNELGALLQAQQARPSLEPARQLKLVSLLFMDIAGSTAIAQHMDPEDVRELFDVALKKLAIPVETHGGHVTRFMGDGFLTVFGAPTAREDDPEQAIRARLEIIRTAQELAPSLEVVWTIPDFQVRVGVNTGLVALGGLTETQDTLMGAPVNLAARLESAAPPGGLLISHDTYRHVRGLFDVEPQEPVAAKGFDEPVQVYRVLCLKPRAFHTRRVEGVETRMVGRHDELKYLQDVFLNAIEDDKARWSPSRARLGWASRACSTSSRTGSSCSPADLVMALALIHHFSIGKNTMLASIAEMFSRLGRWLIIEFVPKDDPQFQRMLSFRKDIFHEYSQASFESSFSQFFSIVDKKQITDSSRFIYLLMNKFPQHV